MSCKQNTLVISCKKTRRDCIGGNYCPCINTPQAYSSSLDIEPLCSTGGLIGCDDNNTIFTVEAFSNAILGPSGPTGTLTGFVPLALCSKLQFWSSGTIDITATPGSAVVQLI
jgi:hypothetical protein